MALIGGGAAAVKSPPSTAMDNAKTHKQRIGAATCVLSFLLGNALCYIDFFMHHALANNTLFYLGQCLIYSASFLGFKMFVDRIRGK